MVQACLVWLPTQVGLEQGVHAEAPLVATKLVPAVQEAQTVAFSAAVKEPDWQAAHIKRPDPLAYVPLRQETQAVRALAPATALAVPGGHFMHAFLLVAPTVGL